MNFEISQYEISEKLYESECTVVYRGHRVKDGLPVILKILKPEAATQERIAAFKHEFNIISKLNLRDVIKPIAFEEYGEGLMIVIGDTGGQSLDRISGKSQLTLIEILKLSVALADTLGLIHNQQIIHKDINPSNIIYNLNTGQVNLIDFGLADEVPERSIALQPPSAIEGTIEYISPEQTGRMNRPVDYRTDFYSLGVSLYRILTGKLPFEASDALGMIHCHIAKIPLPPCDLNPDIPEMLSLIVMKLMAKMPEERYQSALGLKTDFEKCLSGLGSEGIISRFELALEDFSDQLYISRKLYGRNKETDQLLAAFVRASAGERELMLVAGYSGIGKTALVNETRRLIAGKRGYFIESKFDQLQRNVPYFAWIQAFSGFVNYLLAESEEQLTHWKERILGAVGGTGRVLTDVFPNMELIIGSQPDIPVLGAAEAQNRFNYVFMEFIRAAAASEHPLVVFLDDLQWIDAASLNLLQTFMSSTGVSNILLIGAYRDNEVDALHPLMAAIETLRNDNIQIEQLVLGNLSEETANELIADSLHCDYLIAVPLTHLIYSKTGGNPFFIIQTLRTLADKQAIFFDIQSRCWKWDMSALKVIEITDNVADLMVGKIQQLSSETQKILPLAACMGFKFSLSSLGIIAEQSVDKIKYALLPALREGLIASLEEDYQFIHDRVQEAAYALIPETHRKAMHLKIGRLLLAKYPQEAVSELLFEVVDQFNHSVELITDTEEIEMLRRLNKAAGSKSRASAAFASACHYFKLAALLLPADYWSVVYEDSLFLYTELAECEYLIGNFLHSDELLTTALNNACSRIDRARVYRLRQRLYQYSGHWKEAASAALEGLEILGVSFSESDEEIRMATKAEKNHILINLHGRCIADLADAPFTEDINTQILIGLLAESITQFFITRPVLWHLIVLKCVNLCLERGHTEEAPYIYSSYCKMLVSLYNNIPSAFEFSQMSLRLNERLKGGFMKGLPPFFHASVVSNWCQHFATNLPLFDQAFQSFVDAGNIIWANYLTYNAVWLHLEKGGHLGQVIELARRYAAFNQQSHNDIVYIVVRVEEQFSLSLQGKTRSLTDFNDGTFDEAAGIASIERASFGIGICYYRITKQIAAFIAGQFDEALEWADRVVPVLASVSSMSIWGTYYFYNALTVAALYEKAVEEQRQEFMSRMADVLKRLKSWAENCPENFANRFALISAEIARIEGRDQDAMLLYEHAIMSAGKNGFVQNEAIAYEVAANFYRLRGFEKFARIYLAEAAACYARWGASGKVQQLESKHPWLMHVRESKMSSLNMDARILDINTVIKATHAISSEIEMNKLLSKVMHIAIENAGAQDGFLFLKKDSKWAAAVRGDIDKAEIDILHPDNIEYSDVISSGIIRFVERTNNTVVLDDALNQGEFVNDPHVRSKKTRSLLCAPLLNRGRLIGILYLENSLTTHVFTSERVQLLEMILSQAAISLENAGVYEALQKSETLLSAVQQISKVGGWEYDVVTGKSFWTEELYRIHEISNEPGIDHISESLMCYSPEDRQIIQEAFRRACEEGEAYDLEFPFTTIKGKHLWIRTTAQPIYEGNKVIRLIGIVMNITERKHAEDELRKLNEGLEQRVMERTKELEKKNMELEKMNKLFVGRELSMIELKKKIAMLEKNNK